jgi:hypothetical protein
MLRRWRGDIEMPCQDRTRRSAEDIQSIGAGLLRRRRKDIATLCDKSPRRSAKRKQSIGADILRLSKNVARKIAINCAPSPQRSPAATSRLFSNPPNTQARSPNFPPTQRLLQVHAHCRICFARVNHKGGALPPFRHLVCAIRPRPGADIRTRNTAVGECGTRSKPEKILLRKS